jgi:hypothetical protein
MKTTKAQMDQLVKLVADNPGSTAGEFYGLGVGRDGGPTLRDAEKAGRIFEDRDGGWNVKTEETRPDSDWAGYTETERAELQKRSDEDLAEILADFASILKTLGPVPRRPAAPKAAPAKVERPEPVDEVHFAPDGQPRYSRS